MAKSLTNGISCSKLKREAYYSMRSAHSHNYHEIYYLLTGQRKLVMNQTIYELNRGDLAIIPRNTIHRTSFLSDNMHERITVSFENDMLEPLFMTPHLDRERLKALMIPTVIHIPEARRDYAEDLLFRIFYESGQIDDFSNGLMHAYLLEFLLFVFRLKEAALLPPQDIHIANESIQSAISYIYMHYTENLTLEDLARRFNMNSSYFSKKFKLVTGFGFKEYLTSVRMQKAVEFLLNTDYNITDIALRCGFNDSNYFGDAFRKLKGVSPSKFRKNRGLI